MLQDFKTQKPCRNPHTKYYSIEEHNINCSLLNNNLIHSKFPTSEWIPFQENVCKLEPNLQVQQSEFYAPLTQTYNIKHKKFKHTNKNIVKSLTVLPQRVCTEIQSPIHTQFYPVVFDSLFWGTWSQLWKIQTWFFHWHFLFWVSLCLTILISSTKTVKAPNLKIVFCEK